MATEEQELKNKLRRTKQREAQFAATNALPPKIQLEGCPTSEQKLYNDTIDAALKSGKSAVKLQTKADQLLEWKLTEMHTANNPANAGKYEEVFGINPKFDVTKPRTDSDKVKEKGLGDNPLWSKSVEAIYNPSKYKLNEIMGVINSIDKKNTDRIKQFQAVIYEKKMAEQQAREQGESVSEEPVNHNAPLIDMGEWDMGSYN
jgi:hypothetical protein